MQTPKRIDYFQKFTGQKFNFDWLLITIVSLLCTLGLAFLASSLSTQSTYQNEFIKQLVVGVGIGGLLCAFLASTDYHLLFKYRKSILIINLVMLAFVGVFALWSDLNGFSATDKLRFFSRLSWLPVRPYAANDAVRWITIPFVAYFQPSEFTKIALLAYFTSYINDLEKKKIDWLSLKRPLYAFVISAFLILIQPDLGTILLIFAILMSAMWAGKVPGHIIATITAVILILGMVQTFITPYRRERFLYFVQESVSVFLPNFVPQTDKVDDIQQITNVKYAIQNGGLWGKGYGNSEFKQRGLIYEGSTDAILGIIGEEMGFVFTMLFLSLYLAYFWRATRIALQAPDIGGRALAIGIGVWIVSQAFLNISGIIGILPLKGIPLPFVSQGGSSLVINLAATGILLNISSQKVNKSEKIQFSKSKIMKI